ncbi:MAG: endolytic transglycosylase MltG [Persicimonas sp.]
MAKRAQSIRRDESSANVARIALRLCAVSLAVALAVAAAFYVHYRSYIDRDVLDEGESKTLVIPKNTAWPEVVSILRDTRLVERPTYFEYWARRKHLPAAVKAGTYELSGPLDLQGLADELRQGGLVDETEVIFREGLTIFHMADLVDEMGLADRQDFLRAARNTDELAAAGIQADSFEGYLFPDSYRFRKGTSATEIVRKMHGRWQAVWMSLEEQYAEGIETLEEDYDFDRHDIVTLASIVERETGAGAERETIARVFLNRIDRDMRLQTDPTCVYGEDTYKEVPRPKYCKDPLNRYSTYIIDGLPPGPIANPGRASMAAALNPSTEPEATRYLFFVARRDGTQRHYFSKTFAEHKRAIRRFLR